MSKAPRGDEAVAVAAAIARFVADTAPAPAAQSEAISPWQRAALIEGVGAKSLAQGSERSRRR